MIEEKEKYIKNDLKVIQISYFGSLFTEDDFVKIKKNLNEVGLELNRFDRAGKINMILNEFELVSYIAISYPLIVDLIKGIASDAMWDAIKSVAISVWEKTRGKTYNKVSNQIIEKKEISFGLKIYSDKNTFNMELKSNVDKIVIQSYLDKAFDFFKEIKQSEKCKDPCFVEFDAISNKWVKIDVKAEKQKN
jgi:hypothetical protein